MVGGMTFTEFLEMFSIFSLAAPRDIKALYAFKIYGLFNFCVQSISDLLGQKMYWVNILSHTVKVYYHIIIIDISVVWGI